MKSILLSLLFSLILFPLFGQENRQIRARKIMRVQSRTEQVQKGETRTSYSAITYDKKGREIEVKEFDADSSCIREVKYVYNKKGKEILEAVTDSTKHVHTVTLSTYDKWNRLTEKIIQENNAIQERVLYSYNTFDDKTEERVLDGTGNLKKLTRFEYDARSMLTRKTTTNSKGEIVFDKLYRYEY